MDVRRRAVAAWARRASTSRTSSSWSHRISSRRSARVADRPRPRRGVGGSVGLRRAPLPFSLFVPRRRVAPRGAGAAGGGARLRGARAHRPRRRLRLARARARGEARRRPPDHRRRGDPARRRARDAPRRVAAGLREPLPPPHRRPRAHAPEGRRAPAAGARSRAARGAERGARLPLRLRPRRARRRATRTRPPRSPAPSGRSASTSSCSGRSSAATRAGTRSCATSPSTRASGRVVTGNVHAHHPRRTALQDVLVAIRHNTSLESCERERRGNRESILRAPAEMLELFPDDRDAVLRTAEVAARLEFDLTAELGYRYPDFSDGAEPAIQQLAQVCEDAFAERYPPSNRLLLGSARARLEQELQPDRRARARRLLPPPLGGARAGAGDRETGSAGPARRAACSRRGAGAARRSARSSAT